MALRRDMERASRAQALLRDEMLTEAFQSLRAQYLRAWEMTGALDTEAREKLHLAVVVLAKVRAELEQTVIGGQLAGHELDLNE